MRKKQVSIDLVFHALGDPTRRAIVDKLAQRPHSATKLAEPLGITLTAVTQHLQVLEQCGIVKTEKVGRVRTAALISDGFNLLQEWINNHRSVWEQRFDGLGELLNEEE